MNSQLLAPLSSIQQDGLWSLGVSNYQPVRDLRALCENFYPRGFDRIVWDDGGLNKVSLSAIYNSLQDHIIPPPWLSFVWNKFKVSKFAFTTWLVMKERLLTKDRIQSFQMNVNLDCLLCGIDCESHQHLFCACSYTRTILRACPLAVSSSWLDICAGRPLTSVADPVRTHIAYLYISATFYHVWTERNSRMHSPGHLSQPTLIIQRIQDTMRNRLFSCETFTKAARLDSALHSFIF